MPDQLSQAQFEALVPKVDVLSASMDVRFAAVDGAFAQVAASFGKQREYTEFAFEQLRAETSGVSTSGSTGWTSGSPA